MKIAIIRSLSSALFVTMLFFGQANAQSETAAPAPTTKQQFETGPHGGQICPSNDNFKFEMVYNESAKKVDIYFLDPDNIQVEAGNLTAEVTFVNDDKSFSTVNAPYQGKKFTAGVPDGKPLHMCGIVLTHSGQMYGGKFANPSLIK